jgi:CHAT domain-containing protein/tetratricopeptide (TPR) repeat protein
MIHRILQWLVQRFQRWCRPKPQIVNKADTEPQIQHLSDADYERLFMQLLHGVNEGWSQRQVQDFLIDQRINEVDLVEWLRRFGTEVLQADPTSLRSLLNPELGRRMMQLGKIACRELGEVAQNLGRQVTTTWLTTAWSKQGIKQLEAKDYIEALHCFNKALAIDANNHELWYEQGLILGELKAYGEAIDSLNKALSIQPNNHKAWIIRSVALDNLGWYEEALDSCEKALKLQPDDLDGWIVHGIVLSHLKRYEAALTSFEKLLEIKPDDSAAFFLSILMLSYTEHYNEALFFCNQASQLLYDKNDRILLWIVRLLLLSLMGREQEALALCDEVPEDFMDTSIDKEIVVFLLRLCLILLILRNQNILELFYTSCQIEVNKKDGRFLTTTISFEYENKFNSKYCLLNIDRLLEALKMCDKASKFNFKNLHNRLIVFLCKFAILIILNRPEEALEVCNAVLDNYSEHPWIAKYGPFVPLLNLVLRKGYKELFTIGDEIIENYPNYPWLEKIRPFRPILSLLKQKCYEEAFALFSINEVVLENYPIHFIEILRLFIPVLSLIENKQYQESIDRINQIKNNSSNSLFVEVLYIFISLFIKEKIKENSDELDSDPHKIEFNKNIEVTGNDIAFSYAGNIEDFTAPSVDYINWMIKGFELCSQKRWEEALTCFDYALDIKPDNRQTWVNRGIVLLHLGRYQETIESCDQALELKFDNLESSHKDSKKSDDDSFRSQNCHIWSCRGQALFRLNMYEEAIANYDRALFLKQDYHEVWINRGLAARESVECNPQFVFPESPSTQNPNLNKRGYEGELASYQEGLKYVRQSINPQGWVELRRAIGKAHYRQGYAAPYSKPYSYKARDEYRKALTVLTGEEYRELHLKVLQDLIEVCLQLGEKDTAQALRLEGSELLGRLLQDTTSPHEKLENARKFASFNQLRVDELVQSEELVAALELAEKRKNLCLGWLRYGYVETAEDTPKYAEIQQLLNSQTAGIYWHLSPAALTIFILKHKQPPLVRVLTADATSSVGVDRSLQNFENWVKEWNLLVERRFIANFFLDESRELIPDTLPKLAEILDIPAILSMLESITHLILIPHRDLHLLPLHALFPDDVTITYLPSAQTGLDLQSVAPSLEEAYCNLPLLSIEHPQTTKAQDTLKLFDDKSLLYVEMESAIITQMYQQCHRLAGADCSLEAVIQALQQKSGIFHFTGHAYHNIDSPADSALLLANTEQLRLQDIFDNKLDFRPYHLICLSACETGKTGKQDLIDEFVGLASGFLAAGASCVVSTLWRVDEISAALVMIRFYQLLREYPPATALRKAQFWLRDATYENLAQWCRDVAKQVADYSLTQSENWEDAADNFQEQADKMDSNNCPYAHPYYWAAFTITGN